MKLIALCTIWTAVGRVKPGQPFEVSEDEGGNLVKRQFAREPRKDELKADDAADAKAKADAEAADKANAEAAAKAAADAQAAADAKAKADAAAAAKAKK